MKIIIEAAQRLKETEVDAGWFDALSDVAKKAYMKLHPGSKAGKGSKSSKGNDGGKLRKAQEDHKKNRENYSKHRNSMHDESTDDDWKAHDRALKRLENSRDRIARLKK